MPAKRALKGLLREFHDLLLRDAAARALRDGRLGERAAEITAESQEQQERRRRNEQARKAGLPPKEEPWRGWLPPGPTLAESWLIACLTADELRDAPIDREGDFEGTLLPQWLVDADGDMGAALESNPAFAPADDARGPEARTALNGPTPNADELWELLCDVRIIRGELRGLLKPLRSNHNLEDKRLRRADQVRLLGAFDDVLEDIRRNGAGRMEQPWAEHTGRDTAAPGEDRLYVEDIDDFAKVTEVKREMAARYLRGGRLEVSEDRVKRALEEIVGVPFHKPDWGGETSDLYTTNVTVASRRRATAFLLKGPGIKRKQLTIRECGKNGDQLVRLFDSPADLFVVQYVGHIAENVVKDVQGKVAQARARGKNAQFVIIDGQDTARLLHAYGKL